MGFRTSGSFSLPKLLATPDKLYDWKRPGLSADEASIDAAALALCSPCWPLIIDQQVCQMDSVAATASDVAMKRRVS